MKLRRRYILLYVFVISFICLFIVFQSYDKYSRNATINAENKKIIEKYLTADEKQYLIDNNLNTKLFMPYIREKGFIIQNYEYYNLIAKYHPKLKKDVLVNKTNQLVEQEFTLSSLENIFKNNLYSLNQLLKLATTPSQYYPEAKPEFYPNNMFALSNTEYYIDSYQPDDLVKISQNFTVQRRTIYLNKQANQQLTLMCDHLKILNGKECGGLKIEYGYISYSNTNKYRKQLPFIRPGHNDFQLGRSIAFVDSKNFYENKLYLWLLNNSYRYGFVQRYPDDKVDSTLVSNQSGVFRYVGINNAGYLVKNNLSIEQQRSNK